MSLTVKSLNGDASFLLTFCPSNAPAPSSPGLPPGTFTVLIDPWLTGPALYINSKFSATEQKETPCISSLADLEHEPDIVLITQDKPDHCHQQTLCQLSSKVQSKIYVTPAAARRIRSWRHFEDSQIISLKSFSPQSLQDTVYRLPIPPLSPSTAAGEVTISLITTKRDLSGLHNALGLTYKPPSAVPSRTPDRHPPTPPTSPPPTLNTPSTIAPPPSNDRGRTLSVIYTPHGISPALVHPYASSHLINEAALPLTALLHAFDRVDNPWYLGGNIVTGFPAGRIIVEDLRARAWISAHDAEKDVKGIAVTRVKTNKVPLEDVQKSVSEGTRVVRLRPGQTYELRTTLP